MNFVMPTGCTPQSVTIGLLLAAMEATDRYDQVVVSDLVPDALYVPEREALIAAVRGLVPDVGQRLGSIAAKRRLDVVLLHFGDPDAPITVDLALGSLPCAPWVERGFALYRDAHSTWLVPPGFGPAVSVGRDGFVLEIVPPYASLAERTAGIARATADVAHLLQPMEA